MAWPACWRSVPPPRPAAARSAGPGWSACPTRAPGSAAGPAVAAFAWTRRTPQGCPAVAAGPGRPADLQGPHRRRSRAAPTSAGPGWWGSRALPTPAAPGRRRSRAVLTAAVPGSWAAVPDSRPAASRTVPGLVASHGWTAARSVVRRAGVPGPRRALRAPTAPAESAVPRRAVPGQRPAGREPAGTGRWRAVRKPVGPPRPSAVPGPAGQVPRAAAAGPTATVAGPAWPGRCGAAAADRAEAGAAVPRRPRRGPTWALCCPRRPVAVVEAAVRAAPEAPGRAAPSGRPERSVVQGPVRRVVARTAVLGRSAARRAARRPGGPAERRRVSAEPAPPDRGWAAVAERGGVGLAEPVRPVGPPGGLGAPAGPERAGPAESVRLDGLSAGPVGSRRSAPAWGPAGAAEPVPPDGSPAGQVAPAGWAERRGAGVPPRPAAGVWRGPTPNDQRHGDRAGPGGVRVPPARRCARPGEGRRAVDAGCSGWSGRAWRCHGAAPGAAWATAERTPAGRLVPAAGERRPSGRPAAGRWRGWWSRTRSAR